MTARKKPAKLLPSDIRTVSMLVQSCCDHDLCMALHHEDRDQHSGGAICPVLLRVRESWARIVKEAMPRRRAKAGKGARRGN